MDKVKHSQSHEDEIELSAEELNAFKKNLYDRCKEAGIKVEEEINIYDDQEEVSFDISMKSGRDFHIVSCDQDDLKKFLSISFEKYVFLSGFRGICSYHDGYIEVGIRPVSNGTFPLNYLYRRLFGVRLDEDETEGTSKNNIILSAPRDDLPQLEIGPPSHEFEILARRAGMTLKLSKCRITTQELAIELLNKVSGAIFFQLDLLTNIPLSLVRDSQQMNHQRISRGAINKMQGGGNELQYPKDEFENAPLSLYWYARSATNMPLLQFLAFYQVLEFFFPIYSQSEAQRDLKAILKDPTFRGDRDADIAKLLNAVKVSRTGAFGDERSQLLATIMECVSAHELRSFFEEDQERKKFYSSKPKYHKIPLASISTDLRSDTAERIYNIRCKIVHTKSDSRDVGIELLLPFTPDSEQLYFDIELLKFLAQRVLILSSRSLTHF